MSDVTRILSQIDSGDPRAAEQLLPLVYDELRKLAAARLAHEKPGQTLEATALVHEAYLRLVGGGSRIQDTQDATEGERGGEGEWERRSDVNLPLTHSPPHPVSDPAPAFDSRGHFFAAAAEAMRRILVESARRRASQKRGAGAQRQELCERSLACDGRQFDLLDLNDALAQLQEHDANAAQLVKLRYFAGLTHQEAALTMGLTRRAADRLWALARAWLYKELGER